MSENNYILLLTLAGMSFQYEWLRSGSRRALRIGSLALGLNLLTRLTTGLDLMACAAFLPLVLLIERVAPGAVRHARDRICKNRVPHLRGFPAHRPRLSVYRFGSFFNTYLGVLADQQKRLNPIPSRRVSL
jgi:hypothetical protein